MLDRLGDQHAALLTRALDFSGTLFELPAGPVGAAVGLLYREEEGWRDPDAVDDRAPRVVR